MPQSEKFSLEQSHCQSLGVDEERCLRIGFETSWEHSPRRTFTSVASVGDVMGFPGVKLIGVSDMARRDLKVRAANDPGRPEQQTAVRPL